MKLIICIILFGLHSVLSAQNINRPAPIGFPAYEFEMFDSTYSGHYTFTSRNTNGTGTIKWLGLLDNEGYLAWYFGDNRRKNDFHFHPAHDVFTYNASAGNNMVYHIKMDSNLNPIDTLYAPIPFLGDVHEQFILPNGNTAIITSLDTTMDLSGYSFDGQQGSTATNVIYNNILEYTPNHNLVFQWKGIDDIHPSEYVDGIGTYDEQFFDYMHANAIDIDDDGNYLISLRHTNSVIKINRNSGDVMWKLGGTSSNFSFINDSGFSGNHDIRSLGNSQYSLFDNGNTSSSPQQSRGVVYELDTIAMTATRVSEYTHTPLVYAPAMGNYQYLNGMGFINWGRVNRPAPTFTLFDSFNNAMVNLYWEDNWISYRSYASHLTFNLERPTVECLNVNGQVTLTATNSSNYVWSNGETTQSITINQPGTYMVWQPKGIGMVGSHPVIINDISTFCLSNQVIEHVALEERIEHLYQLSGKEVINPIIGQLYIAKYSSGLAKKIVWNSSLEFLFKHL